MSKQILHSNWKNVATAKKISERGGSRKAASLMRWMDSSILQWWEALISEGFPLMSCDRWNKCRIRYLPAGAVWKTVCLNADPPAFLFLAFMTTCASPLLGSARLQYWQFRHSTDTKKRQLKAVRGWVSLTGACVGNAQTVTALRGQLLVRQAIRRKNPCSASGQGCAILLQYFLSSRRY